MRFIFSCTTHDIQYSSSVKRGKFAPATKYNKKIKTINKIHFILRSENIITNDKTSERMMWWCVVQWLVKMSKWKCMYLFFENNHKIMIIRDVGHRNDHGSWASDWAIMLEIGRNALTFSNNSIRWIKITALQFEY